MPAADLLYAVERDIVDVETRLTAIRDKFVALARRIASEGREPTHEEWDRAIGAVEAIKQGIWPTPGHRKILPRVDKPPQIKLTAAPLASGRGNHGMRFTVPCSTQIRMPG